MNNSLRANVSLWAYLDEEELDVLQDEVTAFHTEPVRYRQALELRTARAGLVRILEGFEAARGTRLDMSIHRGLAGEKWRIDLLGICDLLVNGLLLGVYVAAAGPATLWLGEAQLAGHSRSAPDAWAVLTVLRRNRRAAVRLRGWSRGGREGELVAALPGLYALPAERLNSPESLFDWLCQEPAPPRQPLPAGDSLLAAQLHEAFAAPDFVTRPLCLLPTPVYDQLVADRQLASAYVATLQSKAPRVDLLALPAVPTPPAPGAAAGEVASSSPLRSAAAPPSWQTTPLGACFDKLRAGDYSAVLALSSAEDDLQWRDLRSNVFMLGGDYHRAVVEARTRFSQDPARGRTALDRQQLAPAGIGWQSRPAAAAAGVTVEVVDALQPRRLIKAKHSLSLIEDDQILRFRLRMSLPIDYAGYSCRIFIVDHELRDELGLSDADLHQAFVSRDDDKASELQHVLVALSAVLTEEQGQLGERVDAAGQLLLSARLVWLRTPTEEFFYNKTVVVLLYLEANGEERTIAA